MLIKAHGELSYFLSTKFINMLNESDSALLMALNSPWNLRNVAYSETEDIVLGF